MTVLLGVSMGAHAVRMAQPRNGTANARVSSTRLLEAPQQLFFHNQVIDTVDDHVEYLAAESISALAAESEPSMTTGVAYRDAHQADTLHRALENQHLQNYRLVPEVEAVTGGEKGPEPFVDCDGAEIVDRHEQAAGDIGEAGDAGPGDETIQRPIGLIGDLGDGLLASVSGTQVGDDVGVAEVDPDDALTFCLEASLGGGTHPRC